MAVKTLDCKGLKCPIPTMKMMQESLTMAKGDILEVTADCPTFEADVKAWCERSKKALLLFKDEGGVKKCRVQI